jgi:hypothetical protein
MCRSAQGCVGIISPGMVYRFLPYYRWPPNAGVMGAIIQHQAGWRLVHQAIRVLADHQNRFGAGSLRRCCKHNAGDGLLSIAAPQSQVSAIGQSHGTVVRNPAAGVGGNSIFHRGAFTGAEIHELGWRDQVDERVPIEEQCVPAARADVHVSDVAQSLIPAAVGDGAFGGLDS